MAHALRVGFHVSIAGGISNSVDNAKKIGCSAFQIFSRNPRGWTAKPLAQDDVRLFREKLAASGISQESVAVHMPYLPNLSGPESDYYGKSVDTLAGEMGRCGELGIPYLVIHLGSHMGRGPESGIGQLVKAIHTAADRQGSSEEGGGQWQKQKQQTQHRKNEVTVLLENSAGQKNSIGSKFEELRRILDRLRSGPSSGRVSYGICFDTCHAFAAGYDLRTKDAVDRTLDSFDREVGLGELRLIHLNDSKGPINSNLDRHEHIGLGSIGSAGFAALLKHRAAAAVPLIMETPIDEKRGEEQNMQALLGLVV